MNKIQRLASKVGITNQNQMRVALKPYRIAEATTRDIWLSGATSKKHYAVIVALEKVLLTSAVQFLEDPENLLPEKEG
jgi:hypothetical protein